MVDEQKVRYLQSQFEQFQHQQAELMYLIQSVDQMSKVKDESEILAPIGSGIFIRSKLLDSKKMLVNVGSGVVVKKSPKEVIKMLEQQAKELDAASQNIAVQLEALMSEKN
jgi:prefoldin alpha subunit